MNEIGPLIAVLNVRTGTNFLPCSLSACPYQTLVPIETPRVSPFELGMNMTESLGTGSLFVAETQQSPPDRAVLIRTILYFLYRVYLGLASRVRNICYRSLGVNIEGYIRLERISIPRKWSEVTLEAGGGLDAGVVILCSGPTKRDKIRIGSGTYVNRGTIFDAHNDLRIGRNVMIGPNCYFTDANHGTMPGSSVKSQPMKVSSLIIEDEAWIGAHVTVLPGVRIGKGAVIGAGAVVTRDVPAGAFALGVPARVTHHR
jgi:acetyltransferase-like isoleucine patch superfamily enzyme